MKFSGSRISCMPLGIYFFRSRDQSDEKSVDWKPQMKSLDTFFTDAVLQFNLNSVKILLSGIDFVLPFTAIIHVV